MMGGDKQTGGVKSQAMAEVEVSSQEKTATPSRKKERPIE